MVPSYLNSGLTPSEYYRVLGDKYENPHQVAASALVDSLRGYLDGTVLDLGCGPGLATKVLGRGIGVDRSPEMVARYVIETGCPGVCQEYWDDLPKANSAVIVHALHLCPRSRVHQFRWAVREAGVERLVVVSPLKRVIVDLGLPVLEERVERLPRGKMVWGWVASCVQKGNYE
jgi:SAM-dependent methyltransferase